MKRWVVLAVVLLPHCAGCLYYAYPTISHVPELAVDNSDLSVHAFRVDIDKTDRQPDPDVVQYTLSRIPIDQRGLIPGQLEVAPATGVYNPLKVVDGPKNELSHYTLNVRLYRPRFVTQEVKSWDRTRDLQWIPAPDLLAQEKAVDDLLATPFPPTLPPPAGPFTNPTMPTWWDRRDERTPGLGLQPGLANRLHHDALVFAADEYLRLANSPNATVPNMQSVRDRLRSKSQWLRGFADRAPN